MMTNAQGPGLDRLLQLFHAELGAVQFPGVDAKVLDGAAARIQTAAAEVRRAEAELDAARAQLASAQEDALQKAQRALAYARIYAQDSPELLARLDAVALSNAPAAAAATSAAPVAPRRRGRPPKSASATSLFTDSVETSSSGDSNGEDASEAMMAQPQ